MNKQIKRQGISLIMLVIVIVVIVILAVAVIATISKNNPIDSAKYARAINDLASLNEKVKLATITNLATSDNELMKLFELNNVKAEDLGITDTLLEEIGMYRNWYYTNTMPNLALSYKSELVNTPTGISDLYYFAKDGGIKEKQYIYDKVNGVVYDKKGLVINKKSGFSIYALKGLQQGNILAEIPTFSDVTTANTPVEKTNYKLISSGSGWLFKHYDNGDVYGVGPKGAEMNTSQTEMDAIDIQKWQEFKVPEIVGEYKKVINAYEIYIIDNNDDLWAFGNNSYNKFALTDKEQRSHTNRNPIKLNLNGKKVKMVYDYSGSNLFVVTTDNKVYAAGSNAYYNFGLGNKNQINGFVELNIPNVANIKEIQNDGWGTFVIYNNETYFYAGRNSYGQLGINDTADILTFTQIWNSAPYDIDQDIKKVVSGSAVRILKKDNTLWQAGYSRTDAIGSAGADSLLAGSQNVFRTFENGIGTNVEDIFSMKYTPYILRRDATNKQELWVGVGFQQDIGVEVLPSDKTNIYRKIPLPQELETSGIKSAFGTVENMYYVGNDNTIWANGFSRYLGLGDVANAVNITKLNISNIDFNINNLATNNYARTPLAKSIDNKLYITGASNYMYQDKSIQNFWTKVASNVLKFTPGAYIDKNNDLYVSGNDASILGLGITDKIKVPQYIKHTDSRFFSNVADTITKHGVTSIITLDNKLYSTGKYNLYSYISGWAGMDNKYEFVEILTNIRKINISPNFALALSSTNIYGWGVYGQCHKPSASSKTPVIIELPNELNINNIKDILGSSLASFIVTNSGELWATSSHNQSLTGFSDFYAQFRKHNQTNFNKEKVEKITGDSDTSRYVLTNAGNVYLWGYNKSLGIGDSSPSNITQTPVKASITDVVDIECGSGFVVATKKNGEVWATGNNSNGVLGRWIDKNGNYASSNTESAYDWVRCPMLEK